MTHERRKSDSVIVAEKPVNKADKLAVEQAAAEAAAAESVEPRAETKENAEQQSTCRTQGRESVSQALDRIRRIARTRKQEKFTALLHHISVELLEEAFLELKMKPAAGVDRLPWDAYEADFDRRIEDLHARVHSGADRALPSRRGYIPKPDGRQRPLSIGLHNAPCSIGVWGRRGKAGRFGDPVPQIVICRVGERDGVRKSGLLPLRCYETAVDPVINHQHADAVSLANL